MNFQYLLYIILQFPVVLMVITFHEVSHAFSAYLLGDDTAKRMNRLKLNPIAHIDRFGTIILPLLLLLISGFSFTFGYAKPVPINPHNFKNFKRDTAITAAAGPGINFVLAIILAIFIRVIAVPLSDYIVKGNEFVIETYYAESKESFSGEKVSTCLFSDSESKSVYIEDSYLKNGKYYPFIKLKRDFKTVATQFIGDAVIINDLPGSGKANFLSVNAGEGIVYFGAENVYEVSEQGKIDNTLTFFLINLLVKLMKIGILFNLFLGFFNLIPFPPLDGSKVLGGFLPDEVYFRYTAQERNGMIIFMILMLANHVFHLNLLGWLIYPVNWIMTLLIGNIV